MLIIKDDNTSMHHRQYIKVFDSSNTNLYCQAMTTLRENLDREMKLREWNSYNMEDESGVPQPTTFRFLNGKIGEPRATTVRKWAAALGLSEGELRGFKAESPIDSHAVREESPSPLPNYTLGELELWDSKTPLRDDEVALPYFREVEMAAGSGRHEVIENHGMKLRFAKSTLRNQGVQECNAACATVSGNSMEPKLHNGTAIGIDKGTTDIIDGDMYAIDHDGSLRVKYLYKMPGGALRLRSENREEWPDENLSYEESKRVKVIGWVFWWSTLPKRRGV